MGDGSGSLRASNQTTLTGKKMPLPVVMALYRAGFAEAAPGGSGANVSPDVLSGHEALPYDKIRSLTVWRTTRKNQGAS